MPLVHDAPPAPAFFEGPARYIADTPWAPLAAVAATVLICLAPVGVYIAGVAMATIGGASEVDIAIASNQLGSLAAPSGIAVAVGAQVLSLLLVVAFAVWGGRGRTTLRLEQPAPSWAASIAIALVLVVALSAVELAMYKALGFDIFADIRWLVEGLRSPYWWAVAIMAAVLAPLWEEFTFRGFLLSALAKSRLGFWGAALVSNTAWTGLHAGYSYPGIASVFLAGLVMSWLVWRTGSIRPAIVMHALANTSSLIFVSAFAPG